MRKDEEREECEIGAWGIIIAVIIAMVVSFALGHTFYEAPDFKKSPFSDVLMMSIISPLSGVVAAMIWIFFMESYPMGSLKSEEIKTCINFNVMETNNMELWLEFR